ncbi:hypothetical protein F2Q68_00013347 [Brassica cretica]|uniref:Uncharacterized protein n=1 Tax=Brassica cretica TaxID=69181 RepID=A0A8S9HF35_BRACR|nr:hypothetical protein F2Q68_00013347 [Brassica cretica]
MESCVFHKTMAIIIEEGLCKAAKQVLITQLWCHLCTNNWYQSGHLCYWCDHEGEDVHDCSMQKTNMLKDGRYGHWKVRMKLLVRGINEAVWIAMKTGWEEPTIFTAEGKKPKPKEPRQGVVRERVNQEACGVVETMWMQVADLAWDKLEEQVYTVEKRQEINLGSKFMP